MDEADIGRLSEEKWVCSQCSESSVGSSLGKKFVILVKGKKCWLGRCKFESLERDTRKSNE